jgi:hypothetical protein
MRRTLRGNWKAFSLIELLVVLDGLGQSWHLGKGAAGNRVYGVW